MSNIPAGYDDWKTTDTTPEPEQDDREAPEYRGAPTPLTVEFTPFTKSDWYGFAGAERFPDGGEPLLAPLKVDGCDALAIVDANGLAVHFSVGDDTWEISNVVAWQSPYAARALALLKPSNAKSALLAMPGACLCN